MESAPMSAPAAEIWAILRENAEQQQKAAAQQQKAAEQRQKEYEQREKAAQQRQKEYEQAREQQQKDAEQRQKEYEQRQKEYEQAREQQQKDAERRQKEYEQRQKDYEQQRQKGYEEDCERLKKLEEQITELSKNVGGVNNTLGAFMEDMVARNLVEKFNHMGYVFTKDGRNTKFRRQNRVIVEADMFLENGQYAMPVEIKTTLTVKDIHDHIERIKKIREYMDERSDTRKLIGAIAGGIVSDKIKTYAQEQGLYVIIQSGDSVAVASAPESFKPKEW